ncbi:LysM peptidoglycan-binding domain-containing protein [Salirhabdus salicampi]|uniref:LysM peptidoglycan-binding domain-containing protein n=1 Tax=Salirhabdus salicampi TaxID=476102 RepID=UPI0020C5791B|nr:LysM domain-containing protein [Salirhabdus salicampi]MCP8616879.1 LysM peptidoglycan-binding domain-containing protein [Salirhabdus salicampi]
MMKWIIRLSILILIILFVKSIMYDLTVGTLTSPSAVEAENENNEGDVQPLDEEIMKTENETENEVERYDHITYEVEAGDTVLSVIEDLNEHMSELSITTIIEDFEALNPAVDPHQIKVGTTYKFPIYK